MTDFGAAPSYSQVEGLIVSKIQEFVRRYKTDWEETKSAALYGWAVAHRSYDPDVSEYTTWVGFKVWKAMLTYLRKEIRQARRVSLGEDLDGLPAPDRPRFDRAEFFSSMSADAAAACSLVLDETKHFRLNAALVGGPPTPGNVRQAVRECLYDLGRSAKQVKAAFAEIKSVL